MYYATHAICYVYQNIYARKLISCDWYGLGRIYYAAING